jgi:hypothetical protein
MGIERKDGGYSATVEGFLVVNGYRVRLAKTNARAVTFAESCQPLPPGTSGELLIIVDGNESRTQVTLPEGVVPGQALAAYEAVTAS